MLHDCMPCVCLNNKKSHDCELLIYAICIYINIVLCSFQGSPSEDRNFRSDADDTETEEASFSGQEYPSDLVDILEWAKVQTSHLF